MAAGRTSRRSETASRSSSKLRRIRDFLQISQKELGDRLGVSQATVSAFESGESDPKLETIRRYAFALGAQVTHSVTLDGVEFASTGFMPAHWIGRTTPQAPKVTAQSFELGKVSAKADFAVAA